MKDKIFSKNQIKIVFVCFITVAMIVLLSFLGIYKCPFRFLFGIPCPTCGMTRAFMALLQWDFSLAFYYHPLWPLVILSAFVLALYFFGLIRPGKALINAFFIMLSVSLIVCFIIRHVMDSPVVKIDFSQSLFQRAIDLINLYD